MSAGFERIAEDWNAVRPDHVYSRLFTAIAGDPALQTLVAGARAGQQYGLLLMGVLRFLVDDVADELLSRWFASPSLAEDPVPALRDLVERRRDEIEALVATGAVQTNEARRAIALMPALSMIQADAPLAVIEPGCSAGLTLNLDRYAYDYGKGVIGDSTLRLTTEMRGSGVSATIPVIGWRAGIDIAPPNLDDERELRWLRSFVWPGDVVRFENLQRAVEIALQYPPPIVEGDVFEVLLDVVASAPADHALVVMHSMLCEHFTPEMRERFSALIMSIPRELWWVSFELADLMPPSRAEAPDPRRAEVEGERGTLLRLVHVRDGRATERLLALAHPHGTWLRWFN